MEPLDRSARIHALARKSRTVGLTEAERAEQQQLRTEYLHAFRHDMEQALSSICVEDQGDSIVPLHRDGE